MAERVTIQNIADALGVSRNTVSKAINNTGFLAGDTREKVLKKAIEMGYKQFSYMNVDTAGKLDTDFPVTGSAGEIALLTRGFPGNSSYISGMLERFQEEMARLGYGFTMHWVREEDENNLRLPASFGREKTAGIICIEILDEKYYSMLCSLGIPILFVDSPVIGVRETLKADFICPENQTNICIFVREMAEIGKREIGFIGEYMHCQSFYERYMGYRNAMYQAGLPCREEYCVVGNMKGVKRPDAAVYQEYLLEYFSKLESLPDAFICANDYVAFDTMRVFKKLGISVPQDVWFCGYDDTVESQIITPSLTTIHIHNHVMGDSAAYLLASRIKSPSMGFRTIHTQTSLLYRETTGELGRGDCGPQNL